MEFEISRLNLLYPLCYTHADDSDPFGYREGDGEKLFCFELDKDGCLSFEPDKTKLLAGLVFGAKAARAAPGGKQAPCPQGKRQTLTELPRGNYLFAQKREILSRDDIIDMAVEIQLEGLWQRLVLGERLYLRYLFEDGRGVTQLFRPYEE